MQTLIPFSSHSRTRGLLSAVMLLVSCLAFAVSLPGQGTDQPTRPVTAASWLERPIDERKIPTTREEADELLKIVIAVLADQGWTVDLSAEKKGEQVKARPIIEPLVTQQTELIALQKLFADPRPLADRVAETVAQLQKAISDLKQVEARGKADWEAKRAPAAFDSEANQQRKADRVRIEAVLAKAKDDLAEVRRASSDEVVRTGRQGLESLKVDRDARREKLRTARAEGADPSTVSLLREEAFAAALTTARVEREVAVQNAEIEQLVPPKRLDKARLEVETAQQTLKLLDWFLVEDARLEAIAKQKNREASNLVSFWEGQKESLRGARRDAAYLAYCDLQIERIGLQAAKTEEDRVTTEWERPFRESGAVSAALAEAQLLKRAINEDVTDDSPLGLPEDATELRALRQKSRERLAMAREMIENQRLQRDKDRRTLRSFDRGEFAARIEAAQNLKSAPGRVGGDLVLIDWSRLAEEISTARDDRETVIKSRLQGFADHAMRLRELTKLSESNLAELESRLLWTRDASEISLDSLQAAVDDGTTGLIGGLTTVVTEDSRELRETLEKGGRWRLWVGISILAVVAIAVFLVRRRSRPVAVTKDPAAPRMTRSRAAAHVGLNAYRPFLFGAGLIALAWLMLLPKRSLGLVAILAITPLAYRGLKALIETLFDPESRSHRLLPIDDVVARHLSQALVTLLRAALLFVPIGLALEVGGYAASNPGFLELWWLVFRLLVGFIVLRTFLRPSVVKTVISGSGEWAASVRTLLMVAYPVVLVAILGLIALGSLRYSEAVSVIGTWFIESAAVVSVGFLLYSALRRIVVRDRDLTATLKVDDFDDRAAYEAAGRELFFGRVSRLSLRVVFFGLTAYVLARLWPFQGLSLGATDLGGFTLSELGGAALAVLATGIALRTYRQFMEFVLLARTELDRGLRYTIIALTSYAIGAVGGVIALKYLNVGGDQIAWVMSALAIGIGFGLQSIVRNLVSGIILLLERPVQVGDRVTLGERSGVVEKITMRSTTVTTWDNVGIVIPNEELIGGQVVNASLGAQTLRTTLSFGVAYGSDIQLVRKVTMEITQKHGLVLKRPAPELFFVGFGNSSLDFELRFWTHLETHRLRVSSDLRFALDASFRRAGIEIPFPQSDLHVRSLDEKILAGLARAATPAGPAASGEASKGAPGEASPTSPTTSEK